MARILLAEDEVSVRAFVIRALESRNHEDGSSSPLYSTIEINGL